MAKGRRKKRKQRKPHYSTSDVPDLGDKVPKALRDLFYDNGNPTRPIFSFAIMDHTTQGDWGWHLLDGPTAKRIIDFLGQISRSTWHEIRAMTGPGIHAQHRLHHYQDISTFPIDAQQALAGPRYEELGGEMFRFRLSGEERLWGFEISGVFYAVWWDPEHRVYPTEAD